MAEFSWNNLPSVILSDIFSKLSHNDKIRASSTCKNWRFALTDPKCWRNVHFVIKVQDKKYDLERTRFLIKYASKKLHKAVITFDSMDEDCVKEASNVLKSLSESVNVRKLFLEPNNCTLMFPAGQDVWTNIDRYYGSSLTVMVQNSYRLEVLSLGCIEELISAQGNAILESIANKHGNTITTLGLASLKDFPDHYLISDLNISLLKPLKHLQILSMDYCHVNDNLLHILKDNSHLKRLVFHVHGIMEEHPGTTEEAWSLFTQKLPTCELRLSLIHSYDGVDVLHSKILRKEMPLTHLKVLFCEKLNVEALDLLSHYKERLRSIWWVDSMSCHSNTTLIETNDIVNPIIMCCWRCQNLEELVFIGHKYLFVDVYAVIRLRGNTLRRLYLAAADIAFPPEDQNMNKTLEELEKDISESLKQPWTTLVEPQLHPVIWNSTAGDSDEFVLPIVLQDIAH